MALGVLRNVRFILIEIFTTMTWNDTRGFEKCHNFFDWIFLTLTSNGTRCFEKCQGVIGNWDKAHVRYCFRDSREMALLLNHSEVFSLWAKSHKCSALCVWFVNVLIAAEVDCYCYQKRENQRKRVRERVCGDGRWMQLVFVSMIQINRLWMSRWKMHEQDQGSTKKKSDWPMTSAQHTVRCTQWTKYGSFYQT